MCIRDSIRINPAILRRQLADRLNMVAKTAAFLRLLIGHIMNGLSPQGSSQSVHNNPHKTKMRQALQSSHRVKSQFFMKPERLRHVDTLAASIHIIYDRVFFLRVKIIGFHQNAVELGFAVAG